MEDVEQYLRSNWIEIQGVSFKLDVLNKVIKAVDMDIADTMIDACHRLEKTMQPVHPA